MVTEIGQLEAIFRYPVKSMAGERLEVAELGWHGIEGDRRRAFRRINDRGGFPWLTAGKLPHLVLFAPQDPPTHVRTPDGEIDACLRGGVGRGDRRPLRGSRRDDECISVIALDTVREISRLAGQSPDVRRFRPNILPFQEGEWLGGVLYAAIAVTAHDVRCAMVNINPDTASITPEVLKAVVRANANGTRKSAGIYGKVRQSTLRRPGLGLPETESLFPSSGIRAG